MGRKTNRLVQEKSPYLLQHLHNPVDWYPWGEEAFSRAEAEDRPVFLSIGYSTCHWCHVMARESFEDARIAALLNRYFVCVKVDREERPDVDQVYMAATVAMNGSGGWPMSVFLFPDGRPFYAATYIPARGMLGRPGFEEILGAVHRAWSEQRESLEKTATRLLAALAEKPDHPDNGIDPDCVDRAFAHLCEQFDAGHGGFGPAPKFPRPVVLRFLFRYYHRSGNNHAANMALKTLDAMATGGLHDHLGGGFHRYSVDARWHVPHFEKMLYDQALLLHGYLDGYLVSGKQCYTEVAGEIARYVLRDLQDADGGFFSAEDADSEDPIAPGSRREGAFYLWTWDEIVRVLEPPHAEIFMFCYGVHREGNVSHDPQQEFRGRNILYRARTDREAGHHFSMPAAEVADSLRRSRQNLLAERDRRRRPHLDDKILTGWNGLMIGALARAGAILDQQHLVEAARRAAGFLRTRLYDEPSGQLWRRYRDGEAAHAGQLDDYMFLVAGLLDLYQVVQEPDLLAWAIDLTVKAVEIFQDRDRGGFYDMVPDARLPARLRGDYDGAEPAPNSVAVHNFLALARLEGDARWTEMAEQTLAAFAGRLNTQPQALPLMLCALEPLRQGEGDESPGKN